MTNEAKSEVTENVIEEENIGVDTAENGGVDGAVDGAVGGSTERKKRPYKSDIGYPVNVDDGRFVKLEPPDCATGDNEYYRLTKKHKLYGTGYIALRTNTGRVMYIPAGTILEFSRFTWRFMRNRRVAAQLSKYRKIYAYRDEDDRVKVTPLFLLNVYKVLSQAGYNTVNPERYRYLYNELYAKLTKKKWYPDSKGKGTGGV